MAPTIQLIRLQFQTAALIRSTLRALRRDIITGASPKRNLRELEYASRGVLISLCPGLQWTSGHSSDPLRQCLHFADMAQGPVLVFSGPRPTDGKPDQFFDVQTTPEDLLDTWGPGKLVFTQQVQNTPVAIEIGGGFIFPPLSYDTDRRYHWDRFMTLLASHPYLDLRKEITIGSSIVRVNTNCANNEKRCWNASLFKLEELGTYRSHHEPVEMQAGFQAGPDYFAITANKVWAKQRGVTVKARNLARQNHELLSLMDFYWGVRVSFCTGVAQRVMLRELVAELLPAFAQSFTSKKYKEYWEALRNDHDVFGAFQGTNANTSSVRDWLGTLPEERHQFIHTLVRQILSTLKDTGLSPDGKYFSVAWPWDGTTNRCFQVPLDDYTKWMPMLADSDDCATFAYISNACLEAGPYSCRGPNPSWQNRIYLLETSVLCPASTGPWELCHEQTYFFRKLDNNLFWVKAQKDLGNSLVPATLVRLIFKDSFPRDVRQRLLFREERRLRRRLREKDLSLVTAEIVSVLSTP